MCKFEGKDAPGFRTVVAALQRYGSEAVAVVRERNAVAGRELGVKGWCEARELVGRVKGWEEISQIGGRDRREAFGREVGVLGGGSRDVDEVGATIVL